MLKYLWTGLATILAMAMWGAVVFVSASEGWGRQTLTASQDPEDFVRAARQIIDAEHTGNISLVLIEKGQITASHYSSAGAPVDRTSVFQVASLSKWLSAWGVMALVEDGAVNLDAPVSTYLTRWQLPPSDFDNSGVTVRRLLSHTAGLDDALGYAGFDAASDVQTLEESLTKARDASPGKNGVVKVGGEPGSEWKYSGGGYTLLQLLIEEVSGQSFSTFMVERVFSPLGMTRTTFDYSEAAEFGLAENFDLNGEAEPFKWYASLAATSLFTTAEDMSIFIQAQAPGGQQNVLSGETLSLMRTPHASQFGADIWGLGVMLYAPNNEGGFIIGHDGNNEPAINTAVRLNPATGDGIVVLETGSALLATRLASEWVFWKTGNVDNLMFAMRLEQTFLSILIGALIILMIGFTVAWRTRKASRVS